VNRAELHTKLKELTAKTDSGEMSLKEASRDLAGWIAKNHKPETPKASRLSFRLAHLRQLARIGQAKLEIPLREVLAKKGPRGMNPPRPETPEPH